MTNHYCSCGCAQCRGCPIPGPTGPMGPQGQTGAAGVSPIITVAGTRTGAPGTGASVYETITPTGAELLFTIPAGPTGPAGQAGAAGEAGAAGATGPTGAAGADGAAGAQGVQGEQGVPGPRGEPGERGATGPQGIQGVQGEQGPQGEQGVQGIQGEPGPQGIQGATGLRGANGTSVTILGSFDTYQELINAHPTGEPGDSYLVDGDLYVWDETNQTWVNVGHIRGPIGLPGPQGVSGPTGPQGPAGAQGAQGVQGVQGEQGIPGATGATGPVASIIPFSLSKYGVSLGTDEQGRPNMIVFSGFSPAYNSTIYLQEGEWETGSFTIREDMPFSTAFIMTRPGILRRIFVLFSIESGGAQFPEGASIQPFVCLAFSSGDELKYTIAQSSIVYTEPYIGGVYYPGHTLRRGAELALDIAIPQGTLVGIVAGVRGNPSIEPVSGNFTACGGLYIE